MFELTRLGLERISQSRAGEESFGGARVLSSSGQDLQKSTSKKGRSCVFVFYHFDVSFVRPIRNVARQKVDSGVTFPT